MGSITVATLNLQNRQNRWLDRRELIVAELLETQPDLLSLQEVYRPIAQARWLRNQINSRLTGSVNKPYQLIQKRRHHLIKGYSEGIAILSRLPVLSHDYASLGFNGRVALRANVELPNHDSVDFVAVHLHPVATDRQARSEQVLRLTGWLNNHNPVPKRIIAGDFNEIPSGPAIHLMKQTYRSAFEDRHGYDPIATYPTAMVTESDGWSGCLDYIFLSQAVSRVIAARLFCNKPAASDAYLYPSDHVGLLIEIGE